jgi:hypothetical protein
MTIPEMREMDAMTEMAGGVPFVAGPGLAREPIIHIG